MVVHLQRNDESSPISAEIKHCPVFLLLDPGFQPGFPVNGQNSSLSATDLLKSTKLTKNSPFWLRFTPLNGASAVQLQFWPNRSLVGEALSRNKQGPSANREGSICHFEATNAESGEHSAISICSDPRDINGLIRLNGRTFALGVDAKTEEFYLVPEGTEKSCEWPEEQRGSRRRKRSGEEVVGNKMAEGDNSKVPRVPEYYSEYTDGKRRHVELILIADSTVYKKYEADEQRVHDRLQSIASAVNSLYAPLNIRVTLVWADIWRDVNPIEVTEEADKTLRDFLGYRKLMLADHPHDNAQLLTDVHFGSVIGKAYKGTMCSFEYSGGVIVDHAELPAFVGLTVAHEMGHNFGMDHDAGYPDPCKCAVQQCIMAPASSNIKASSFFSYCSLDTLSSAFRRGVDYCLHNVPKSAFGGAKCGNGILEEGEECDCGSTQSCPNRCCVAAQCKLAKNAECAEGECCDLELCKPRPGATVCRAETNECDLPEYCDGKNPICPPDFFVQDGHTCPSSSEDFCHQGLCGSREKQCQFIWGPTAKSSNEQCYAYNEYGSFSGNCGYNRATDQYIRCKTGDATCGRLQCQHESERPVFGDPSTVYSAYNVVRDKTGKDVVCRVVRTTMTGVGKQQAADPGMVPNGAKCGRNGICVDAHCRNSTEVLQMVSKCQPEDCNGKGVCNNVGNCHCIAGYGGIACDLPGPGGSVNSGPANGRVFNPGIALLYLLFLAFFFFLIATIYCRRKKGFWLHKRIWSKARVVLELRSFNLIPTRKAPPPPGATIQHTHRQSWNAVWGDAPPGTTGQGEVLHVDASRPYLLGGARAVVVKKKLEVPAGGREKHTTPLATSKMTMDQPTTHVQYFSEISPTNPPAKPQQKPRKWPKEPERRALVVSPGYDTVGSTSSEEPESGKVDGGRRNGGDEQGKPVPPPHRGQMRGSRQEEKSSKKIPPKLPSKVPIVMGNQLEGHGEAEEEKSEGARVNVRAMAAKFDKK